MSWEVIERNWQGLRGRVLAEWDNLSDDAFDQIIGKHDRLVARIQEAYGTSREEAERQIEAFEEANQDYRPPNAS
ncbi:MAG TPA: general stress protein CsbD [Burkholderiales bacterium]|nr:general stress protein CsbD [Burkholderiales bacterium]